MLYACFWTIPFTRSREILRSALHPTTFYHCKNLIKSADILCVYTPPYHEKSCLDLIEIREMAK